MGGAEGSQEVARRGTVELEERPPSPWPARPPARLGWRALWALLRACQPGMKICGGSGVAGGSQALLLPRRTLTAIHNAAGEAGLGRQEEGTREAGGHAGRGETNGAWWSGKMRKKNKKK